MEKLISIILPTFNGSQYIKSAIESILAQSYKNWELIIIDDGSTDMTEAIVFNYVNANSNIKYFKNEKNIGIQKSLNKGLHLAKGEYIARIDDDDEWIDKEKLKKQLDFFKDNREYVLLGTGVIMSNYNGNLIKYLLPEKDKEIRLRILSKNCFAHPTVMYKKEMALNVGGYSEEEEFKHIEDYELWLKLGIKGKFANIPDHCVFSNIHSGSMTYKNRIIQAKGILNLIRKYKKSYPNFYKGYFISFLRFIFFKILKFLPFSESFLYKIQARYKSI